MAFFRSGGIRVAFVGLAVLGVCAAVGLTAIYFYLLRDLPDFQSLDDYRPPVVSEVFDRNGLLIGEFYTEKRRLVSIDALPQHVLDAFVAAEDGSFYEHQGIDYVSILRAAIANLREGGIAQGASTITQQMVKSLLLSPERTYERKLREIILARRIEQQLSKKEILHLYLNQIYFGHSAWGIDQAARSYFGKQAPELSISEAALLAGLPQRPSAYDPSRNPEAAESRRRYVLSRMLDDGYVDAATHDEELARPPLLAPHPDDERIAVARYFTEEVRKLLFERIDGDVVNNAGLRIETTLDSALQAKAQEAVRAGLVAHDHRRGYRGPIRKVAPEAIESELEKLAETNAEALEDGEGILEGVVVSIDRKAQKAVIGVAPGTTGESRLGDVDWARKADPTVRPASVKTIQEIFRRGDVARFVRLPGGEMRLDIWQEPEAEAALLSIENGSGDVIAMVGGYDFDRSEFNRAVQARRQPGSAFKPFIYGAALTRGYTPVSTVVDRPVVYTDPVTGFVWAPRNYGRRFHGPMTMRAALAKSINNATVHLFRDLGVRYVIDYARRLGIQAPLASDLSLALGSSAVTLLELNRAYAVYPAGGKRVIPRFITRVTDRDGNLLLEDVPLGEVPPPVLKPLSKPGEAQLESYPDSELLPTEQLISPADAFLMDLLRAVVLEGTGRALNGLGRPVAGKTGTTNDYSDAWFMGFSPEITTGVWVGHDDNRVLGRGESGGRAALPIWGDFMKEALAPLPQSDFPVPPRIEFHRIDRASGLLAETESENAYVQPFLVGTAPERSFTDHNAREQSQQAARDDFF